jgi:hypothetical protein
LDNSNARPRSSAPYWRLRSKRVTLACDRAHTATTINPELSGFMRLEIILISIDQKCHYFSCRLKYFTSYWSRYLKWTQRKPSMLKEDQIPPDQLLNFARISKTSWAVTIPEIYRTLICYTFEPSLIYKDSRQSSFERHFSSYAYIIKNAQILPLIRNIFIRNNVNEEQKYNGFGLSAYECFKNCQKR